MTYHIVLNRPTDLSRIAAAAEAGDGPRHSMAMLAERLGATVHDGSALTPSLCDRLVGMLTGTKPLWWAIARSVRASTRRGDVLFCTGEDVGLPVAFLCGGSSKRRVAIMVHHITRTKGKVALRLFGLGRKSALLLAVARPQVEFLRAYLSYGADRVRLITDQTDTRFFTPAEACAPAPAARPIVMSVGLEQRDYATLAAASAEMAIDVQISGFSADTKTMERAFPAVLPGNMSCRFYPWPALQALYRQADVAVISLFPNRYAAGVQALMEALSSGKPVVVTATDGLAGYLDANGALRVVPPGDAPAMRAALELLLADRAELERAGHAAVSCARAQYALERYVDDLVSALSSLAEPNPGQDLKDGR